MRRNLLMVAFIGLLVHANGQQPKPVLKITCNPEFETAGKSASKSQPGVLTNKSASKSQSGVLTIKIQNFSWINAKGLRVRYVVLKQDLQTKAVSIETQGEQVVDIGPGKIAVVKTEELSFAQQLRHERMLYMNSRGRMVEDNLKVTRSGVSYFGTGVAVYQGLSRLTTYYDNTTVQDRLQDKSLFLSGAWADGRDAANYVGPVFCGGVKSCHMKEETGNQVAKWQASPHAKAFETLGSDRAKKIAKAKGIDDPQKSGACLKCHSTAYNFTEALATKKIRPKDGVACESCHGPGKKYLVTMMVTMEDLKTAKAGGLVHPATASCQLCHNEGSPTFKGFDEKAYVEKIAHPNPAKK